MAKFTQNETLKKLTNRKIVLGAGAIMVACAFIAITSFVPFIITGEKLASEKFWTDELIIVAITIFAMVSAMYIGQASNAQDTRSRIARKKVEFIASLAKITSVNAFIQWVKKVLQPRDIQSIKERELRRHGIDDYTVLNLEDAQVRAMAKDAQKFNGRYYSQITQEQADFILSLRDGVRKIPLVEPEYYLSVSSIDVSKTITEKSGRENFKKTIKLVFSIVTKLIFVLIPALIFGALARDLTQGDVDQAEAWATFASRMFNMLTSSFMGYIVGCQMNDIDADYIELRILVHNEFLDDKGFKPKDQQEIAKAAFVDRVKRENQEYAKELGLIDDGEKKSHEQEEEITFTQTPAPKPTSSQVIQLPQIKEE